MKLPLHVCFYLCLSITLLSQYHNQYQKEGTFLILSNNKNNLDTCSSVWNNQSAEYHHCHHSFAPGVTPTWQIDRTTFQPNIPTWFFNFASRLLWRHINRSLNKLSPQKIRSRHQRFSLIGSSLVTKPPISLWVDQASQLIKCLLKCERPCKCFQQGESASYR